MTEPEENTSWTTHHRLSRIIALRRAVAAQMREADVSEITPGSMEFYSFHVLLPGGADVMLALDADLPDALYEVVRFINAGDQPRHPFEGRGGFGSAFTDKLPKMAVLDLLRRYAALGVPAQPDRIPRD